MAEAKDDAKLKCQQKLHSLIVDFYESNHALLSLLLGRRHEPTNIIEDDIFIQPHLREVHKQLRSICLIKNRLSGSDDPFTQFRCAQDQLHQQIDDNEPSSIHDEVYRRSLDVYRQFFGGNETLRLHEKSAEWFLEEIEYLGNRVHTTNLLYKEASRAFNTFSARELKETESPFEDGPFGMHKWRHNGEVTVDSMQPGAWKMVKHLWEQPEHAASFDELKVPIYSDPEHVADEQAYGSFRKAANTFFRNNNIPWKVRLSKASAYLQPAEKSARA